MLRCIDGFLSVRQCLANAKSTLALYVSVSLCISLGKRGSNVLLNDVYSQWMAFARLLLHTFFNDLFDDMPCDIFRVIRCFFTFLCFNYRALQHNNYHFDDIQMLMWRRRRLAKYTTFEKKKNMLTVHICIWFVDIFSVFFLFLARSCANIMLGVDWLHCECDMFSEYEIFLIHWIVPANFNERNTVFFFQIERERTPIDKVDDDDDDQINQFSLKFCVHFIFGFS